VAAQSQRRWISIAKLDKDKGDRERVVVLGSGWAGYTLGRDLDQRRFQTVIISPRSYFVFTPLLASTSTGTLEFRTALEPVRSRRSKAAFFQGWADAVDMEKKEVEIEEAVEDPMQSSALVSARDATESDRSMQKEKGKLFSMRYDKLVVAVGCYSQTFKTPGVKEVRYIAYLCRQNVF
jgi:NADH dehydrogenase FAD-containing subunit